MNLTKPPEFSVKNAEIEHIYAICDVLIHSIKELCYADHHNNKTIIQDWIANKTPENVNNWINDPNSHFLVAINSLNKVIGVTMVTTKGEILLNYVHPAFIGNGIGKIMLETVESLCKMNNVKTITASSTLSALGFYKTLGFKEDVTMASNFTCKNILIKKMIAP